MIRIKKGGEVEARLDTIRDHKTVNFKSLKGLPNILESHLIHSVQCVHGDARSREIYEQRLL